MAIHNWRASKLKIKTVILSSGIILLLFFCLIWFITVSSQIISTQSFEPIEAVLKDANKDTLVIFDVDDVLIMSTNQAFQRPTDENFLNEIFLDLKTRFGEEKTDLLESIILLQETVQLVDPKIVSLINTLQIKGVPIIGLTAMSTGAYGKIQSIEDWRIQKLESMGINLNRYWGNLKSKQFSDFNIKDLKDGPVFKAGILFSAKVPKGEALQAFLQYVKLKPSKIIFVDDLSKNVKSVQRFCNKAGIEFIGFEYLGAYVRAEPVNKIRVHLQYEVLEKEHKWLSDKEADRRLNDSKKSLGLLVK